ncbi:hypothetical protein P8C59_001364 [Phyllachora maydis]|uniref:DUF6987 domain-containing protein n=1 Tax=Phyllachora maydis TaxID=1825666 RepID=A0AAD9HZL1_9PEZI|nr:hypothetical protein P8C59_001364 [Phyllachora maydis]
MSDIGKKTLSSLPAGKTTTAASHADGSQAKAPRSTAANSHLAGQPPQREGGDEDTYNHYTHQKESQLDDIHEGSEQATQSGVAATGTSKKLGHYDDDASTAELLSMREVEPEAIHGHEVPTEAGGRDKEEVQQPPSEGDEGYGSRSSLTERAKQAFDLAAYNAPTSQARDQFPTDAQSGMAGLSVSGAGEKAAAVPGGAGASQAGEKLEQAGAHAQEGAERLQATNVPEGAEEVDEGAEQQQPSLQGVEQSQVPDEVNELGEELKSFKDEGKTLPAELRSGIDDEAQTLGIAPSQLNTAQLGSILHGLPTDVKSALPTELRTRFEGIDDEATEKMLDDDQKTESATAQEHIPEAGVEGVEGTVEDTAVQGTEPEKPLDFSILKEGRVNKGGNVVNENGKVIGRVVQGVLAQLIGRRADENGDIWGDNGKVLGKAEPIRDDERDEVDKGVQPFESFPDAVVDADGMVVSNGEFVGKVVAGDLHNLRGKHVDADGDILDRAGNVIGKAERWEPEPEPEPEPEAEPEVEVDNSLLAGKRVNKAGNVVDSSGVIYGRVVEGDVNKMIGRMCDKNGNILSESGDILGRAELVPEGEREGQKEGPFADLQGCTVGKDGKIVTPSGEVVGRLVSGDRKMLYGRPVDEDGDVLDRNGNSIGKAERWEEPEVEKKKSPLAGRRVNKEGNVVDADGNLIGKLTTGNLSICGGKEIDDDGDVVDGKGTVIGHVSLLDEIEPEKEEEKEEKEEEEEEEETAEMKAKREQGEQDKQLAVQMTVCISQCLDKIKPICKMITQTINAAERKPEDERDEDQLVREVRPLIEEGGRILQEAKGVIKGLDPDGRIAANAKHKTAAREATPEEYQLADVLKDLAGEVTETIENAKRKIEDMPHAKKELNPLWGLLNEPLFQILAAVGLLLNGVLTLVGKLLSGLGLGGLLDGLLGSLGLNRVLEGLGLGQVTKALGGGDKKKGGGGGGLLGGLLGGGK